MGNLRQEQELNNDNVSPFRKEFIELIINQDNSIDNELDVLTDGVDELIGTYSSSGKIQDQDSISEGLPELFKDFGLFLLLMMQFRNKEAAQIQVLQQAEIIDNKYSKVSDIQKEIIRWEKKISNYPNLVSSSLPFRTFPGSNYQVGRQIKTIEKESVNVVRAILEVGIDRGKSAKQIAADIDLYIKPLPEGRAVSPFQWIRDKLGRVRVIRIEKGLVPAGSVSFNSFRIARTEINNTYRHAVTDIHRGQLWVEGYRWVLSPSHPKHDICDTWASEGPYKENELPEGHPHCMCYVTTELVPVKEFR